MLVYVGSVLDGPKAVVLLIEDLDQARGVLRVDLQPLLSERLVHPTSPCGGSPAR
jgi:hypothetical protein